MPDRIEDLLRSLPDGACIACLARRDGQTQEDVEVIIGHYLTYLPLRVNQAICPLCGGAGRVARLRHTGGATDT